MKTNTILIVAAVLTIGGGAAYFLLRKKPASTGVVVPPPKAISKQTNLISQVGSFLGSDVGQNLVGTVEGWFD